MSKRCPGLFIEEIDWNDPRYAPWNIAEKLGDLSEAQLDAVWADDDVDFPPLSEDERIEMCKKIPCRVELGRSNVCTGVERSWPKRMFDKENFSDLTPKEQRCINRSMQKKAVLLYNTYVDENRLKERVRRRTKNALAYYYEERYLKHRFMRIKALGDKQNVGTHDGLDEDDDEWQLDANNDEMTDDESDDGGLIIDEGAGKEASEYSYAEHSQDTVINTGTTQSDKNNEKGPSQIDLNANNDDGINHMANDENQSNNSVSNSRSLQKNATHPKRLSNKRTPLAERVVQSSNEWDSDEEEVNIDDQYDEPLPGSLQDLRFADVLSLSVVTSTVASPVHVSTEDMLRSPESPGFEVLSIETPGIGSLRTKRRRIVYADDAPPASQDEDTEPDSIDFLTQEMHQERTSTQS